MTEIVTIGVMTGNSLDAADVVLTSFSENKITDIDAVSVQFPPELTVDLLKIRSAVSSKKGVLSSLENDSFFKNVLNRYTLLCAEAIQALVEKSGMDKQKIAAIGFHGQTCDHFPPSVAGEKPPYTVQIADAQALADMTNIPVIYDFRSDDIFNGGEGAPLAPAHNMHISADLESKGLFPAAFCNAGNTGNIAVVSKDDRQHPVVKGWDAGAFNHFIDLLTRRFKNEPCDKNGQYGQKGTIVPALLSDLFDHAATTNDGGNFYKHKPPKSSDPTWYRDLDILKNIPDGFENTLRTVEYLSAYTLFHTLSFVPENHQMPSVFLTFGGGWKNPVVRGDFENLLNGKGIVLDRHKDLFSRIRARFAVPPRLLPAESCGYGGEYMEARIFADMAYCRITGKPFSFPETTGCKNPTVAGIYKLPRTDEHFLIEDLFNKFGTKDLIRNDWNKPWSRAVSGVKTV